MARRRELGVHLSRWLNLLAALAWALMMPIAWAMHWLASVPFVSTASIYANFASHLAAWRADVPTDRSQLDRIEQKLDQLLSESGSTMDTSN